MPKLVLLAMAERVDDRMIYWGSIESISDACGLHRRTVKRATETLIESGYLANIRESKGRVPNQFQLTQPGHSAHVEADSTWAESHINGTFCPPPENPNLGTESLNLDSLSTQPGQSVHQPGHRVHLTRDNRKEITEGTERDTAPENSEPTIDLRDTNPIDEICEQLADRIHQHTGNRPAITKAWRTDTQKLIDHGPPDTTPGPLDPDRVRRAINTIFDTLADPQPPNNFCWATQVTSPHKLAKHWTKAAAAARDKHRATTQPTRNQQRQAHDIDRIGQVIANLQATNPDTFGAPNQTAELTTGATT